MVEINTIYNEDCLEGMKRIPDGSVDMILCDLPYGTTACAWDTIIPFESLWAEYKRIAKDHAAVIITSSQPFTSKVVTSNINSFSHQWVWKKNTIGNFLLANIAPLKNFEDVLVFINRSDEKYNDNPLRYVLREISHDYGIDKVVKLFENEGRYSTPESARVHASYKMGFSNGKRFDLMDKKMFDYLSEYIDFGFGYERIRRNKSRLTAADSRTYNPQGVDEISVDRVVPKKPTHIGDRPNQDGLRYKQTRTGYPRAIIEFDGDRNTFHPTQKPVALFEYLIKTYTNEGETVLDNCMGSGTTAIACINTDRNYIGFELDEEYHKLSEQRISDHIKSKDKSI